MRPPPLTETLPPGACLPPAELFPHFAARPGCVFLDSALPSATARHSILACEPSLVLRGGPEILPRLRAELAARAVAPIPCMPFAGGAIGYLSYEYGAALDGVPPTAGPDDLGLPDLAFAFHDSALVHDHLTGITTLVAPDAVALDRLRALILAPCSRLPAPGFSVGPLRADLLPDAYAAALARIRAYIAAGDTYQVNFTHRFTAPFSGSAAGLYSRLRALNPAPHAAFLDFDDFQIVSSTPERLLRVSGRTLETRPIKGTVARATDPAADAANRARLLASAKDHAELLMIVDLARNDLGRVATAGSVHVAARHDLETYATVHHLVATVRGQLAPGLDRFDALRALHPGGSITGAPKIRAMQIIAELETSRRHAYTGALGFLGYDGDADFAIAIRTITCARGLASYHVGGGITWDSDATSEYEETLHKGRALHEALQPV
ncbi:MAG: aminodeoxychorismate synthase component I [Burkholderiales bacterium]|nr:aminodeoxychorismate synthase component I [Opitutaceae bacterium]